MKLLLPAASTFALALGLVVPSAAAPAVRAEATRYEVDGVHSSVIFKVKHFNAANFYGRFDSVSGSVALDEKSAAASSVEISIAADSLHTGNPKRDSDVKGPDMLSVKEFPAMTFKSKSVKGSGDAFDVEGELTFHGVTKPLSVKVAKTGTGKGMKGETHVGYETTFSIKRTDFGMKYMVGPLGDDVQITISLECVPK